MLRHQNDRSRDYSYLLLSGLASFGGLINNHVAHLFLLLQLSSQFTLSSPFSVVLAEVAVLAYSVGIVGPVDVRAGVRLLLSAHCMVTVLAHSLSVERSVDMGAVGDLALGCPSSSALLSLLGLLLLAGLSGLAHRLFTSLSLLDRRRRVAEAFA